MSLAQYNGKNQVDRKRVWYGGTTALIIGQAVAYDTSDTTAPLPISLIGGTTSPDPSQIERGQIVQVPVTALLGGFAGIVDSLPLKDANGVIVASWIDIVVPRKGDVVDLYTNASVTKNSTILGITNAGGATLVSVSDATFNVDVVAICLQTVDRSGTAGLVRAKFL